MFIKKIIDYDIEAQEADLLISDNRFELICYAHPFERKENKSFKLIAFCDNAFIRAMNESFLVEKNLNEFYGYKLQGKLINLKEKLVAIGDIIIELSNDLPGDIEEDEFMEFTVTRIDFMGS